MGTAFEAFETAGWETCADDYVRCFAPLTARLAKPLLDAAGVAAGTRLLDVGCGAGELAAEAVRRGAVVHGCDVSPTMAALAARAAEITVADAHALPYADGAFDAVLANMVWLHLGRPDQATREALRVLGSGGVFACSVYDVPARARTVGVLGEALRAVGPAPATGVPPGPDMFALAADGALDELLADAGLQERFVERVTVEHAFESADALWDGLTNGTVRAGALLRAQDADRLARIRVAYEQALEPYRDGERIVLPTAFLIAGGRKP